LRIVSQEYFSEHLADIDRAECLRLLGERGLGRIAVVARGRPVIFPVNFALVDDAIVICIRRGGDLDGATSNMAAAFEIDSEDNIYHEGWSVLAIGRCIHLPPSVELVRQAERIGLSPWAGGDRNLFVRVSIDEISGRRIRRRAR
jgi:nitroimidazol reductase NimA-like FMN-containing flavoprotein (pyridoxamine 5'-phosphate oxidase superfamily)